MWIPGKSIPGRRNSKCRRPGVGVSLACLRGREEGKGVRYEGGMGQIRVDLTSGFYVSEVRSHWEILSRGAT